jgi:hypothetical protein
VSTEVEPDWNHRDWREPVDLDKFCFEHRSSRIVFQPDYGFLTGEAWSRYLNSDWEHRERVKRRRAALVNVHRSVHVPLAPNEQMHSAQERPPYELHRVKCFVCSESVPDHTIGVHRVMAHNLPSSSAPS